MITVFLLFPPTLPVTGNNMNYAVVAFAVIILISTIQWFVDGRKNFQGPSFDEAAFIGVEGRHEEESNDYVEESDKK